MADEYIDVPIVFDETELYQIGLAKIQESKPNWVPAAGSQIDILLRLNASFAAIGAEVQSTVPYDIFTAFGKITNKLPTPATPAVVDVLLTMKDASGYTVPALTPVGLSSATMTDPVGFQTQGDLIVPPGSTTVTATIVAIEAGTAGNSLDTVVRADSLPYVTSIAITGGSLVTSGGEDAEAGSDYVDRLSRLFELWTDTPIRGREFSIAAQQVAGVYRCCARENFNPADGTTNNERYVALCPIDINGAALSTTVKNQLQAYIESIREWGFVCPVVDPSPYTINVTYTANVDITVDPVTVKAEIADALGGYLNRAVWGMPRISGRLVPLWNWDNVVRINKVLQQIENVANVNWATVQIGNTTVGSVDITMPGSFPLPVLGAVVPTIVNS